MDKASVYGTGDCRFESYQDHLFGFGIIPDGTCLCDPCNVARISGLVVEYIVAIDVTRVRFPADALLSHVAHVQIGLVL